MHNSGMDHKSGVNRKLKRCKQIEKIQDKAIKIISNPKMIPVTIYKSMKILKLDDVESLIPELYVCFKNHT